MSLSIKKRAKVYLEHDMTQNPAEATFRHKIDIQIRFNDVDTFGHINNNAYFAYYDLGKERYLTDVLTPDFHKRPIVPVVANINADFFLPIFYGTNVQVETSVVAVGTKSFTLLQQAVDKENGTVFCRCKSVMVCYNTETKCPVEIPEDYKAAIEEFEKR